jgi:hypothetical protein
MKKPKKPHGHKPKKVVTEINCIIPTVKRYFYIPKCDLHLKYGSNISVNLFINDSGDPTAKFTIFSPNGYVNLYINGVMQEGNLYEVHTNYLTIIPTDSTISAGTPIIIESVGFSTNTYL